VTDDVVSCDGPVEQEFDHDGVQVYFDARDDADRDDASLAGVCAFVLVPASNGGGSARIVPIGPGRSGTDAAVSGAPSIEGLELRSARRADGYDLDLRLPLTRLGRIPESGDKIGFDLIVNDNDGTFRRAQQMIWTGAGGSRIWLRRDYHPPQDFGILVF
jgi:hypothetical protein